MKAYSVFFAVTLTLSMTLVAFSAEEGLVGYWNLDAGSGGIAKDAAGNHEDGDISGAEWVQGKYGNALSFDGQDDVVDIPDAGLLDEIPAITMACWAKITGTGASSYPRFVTKGHDESISLHMDVGAGNKFKLIAHIDGVEMTPTSVALDAYFDEFHHYAFIWDGKEAKFYIDGEEQSTHPMVGQGITVSDFPIQIGNNPNGRPFEGIIDEVGLWSIALSQEQLQNVMEHGFQEVAVTKGRLLQTWASIKIEAE